jgi:DNA polymerase-1
MNSPRARLHVLDGTAALFRGWFGVGSRRSPEGLEVGALAGLAAWLSRALLALQPTHLAVVFDAGTWTFRNEIYDAYKANRGAPPEELVPQFDLAMEMAVRLGCAAVRVPGFEADDLMATLAHRARRAGLDTVLVTPDKDVLQLVGDGVWVADPKDFRLQGEEGVVERMGVRADQLVDYMALAGDPTDHIPGVSGIGPKTARILMGALGSLDALYDDLDRVAELGLRGAPGIRARLEEGRGDAELSRRLARLRDDVPLGEGVRRVGDLRWRGPRGDAGAWFQALGLALPRLGRPPA